MTIQQHYQRIAKLQQRRREITRSLKQKIKNAKTERALYVYNELHGKFKQGELLALCDEAGIHKKQSAKIASILAV